VHAPPGKQIAIHVKNLNDIVSEFESSDLHFEKIVPVGSEVTVYVHPLASRADTISTTTSTMRPRVIWLVPMKWAT